RYLDPDALSFKEFLWRTYDPAVADPEGIRMSNYSYWDITTINDKLAVDYVIRYEELVAGTEYVSRRIGIPIDTGSIRTKTNSRDKSKKIEQHYDEESDSWVRKLYSRAIESFDYNRPF